MDAPSTNIFAPPLPCLPRSAEAVLKTIEAAGHEAWIVGGFVRDAVMGRPSHDVDIATSAHWRDVKAATEAAGMRTFETGVAHGTLSVLYEDQIVEVTTYRSDGSYLDARHPESVSFVNTIDEDLARRDFTMNALAFHPQRGLYDPYGGLPDIEHESIRAVGDPTQRFGEDALRIVRAIRFASELGFRIESTTLQGAIEQRERLNLVAVERIRAELDRLLCGSKVLDVLLAYPQIIEVILPEIIPLQGFDQKSPYHMYDIYEHTAHVVACVPPTPKLRWAALLHDIGKPNRFSVGPNGQGHFFGHALASAEIAKELLFRLKIPMRLAHDIELLVLYHDTHIPATPKTVKRLVGKLEGRPDLVFELCELQKADALAHAPGYQERGKMAAEVADCLAEILASEAVFQVKDLAISGKEILALGLAPGPRVGELLDAALNAVIDEEVPNTKDALQAYIASLI